MPLLLALTLQMTHTTFPWNTVRNEIERPNGSPIEKLIDYIVESKLSESLHAATMLTNLRIGRSKNFSRNDGELTIEHIKQTDSIVFNYYSSENSEPWQKKCKSNEIISTFKYVISKRLRWVQNAES